MTYEGVEVQLVSVSCPSGSFPRNTPRYVLGMRLDGRRNQSGRDVEEKNPCSLWEPTLFVHPTPFERKHASFKLLAEFLYTVDVLEYSVS
jgi:hypothetical protein